MLKQQDSQDSNTSNEHQEDQNFNLNKNQDQMFNEQSKPLKQILNYGLLDQRVPKQTIQGLKMNSLIAIFRNEYQNLSLKLCGSLILSFSYLMKKQSTYLAIEINDFYEKFKKQDIMAYKAEKKEGKKSKGKKRSGKKGENSDDDDSDNEKKKGRKIKKIQGIKQRNIHAVINEMAADSLENPRHMTKPQETPIQFNQNSNSNSEFSNRSGALQFARHAEKPSETPIRQQDSSQFHADFSNSSAFNTTDGKFKEKLQMADNIDIRDLGRHVDNNLFKDMILEGEYQREDDHYQFENYGQSDDNVIDQAGEILKNQIGISFLEKSQDESEENNNNKTRKNNNNNSNKKNKKQKQDGDETIVKKKKIKITLDETIYANKYENLNSQEFDEAINQQLRNNQDSILNDQSMTFDYFEQNAQQREQDVTFNQQLEQNTERQQQRENNFEKIIFKDIYDFKWEEKFFNHEQLQKANENLLRIHENQRNQSINNHNNYQQMNELNQNYDTDFNNNYQDQPDNQMQNDQYHNIFENLNDQSNKNTDNFLQNNRINYDENEQNDEEERQEERTYKENLQKQKEIKQFTQYEFLYNLIKDNFKQKSDENFVNFNNIMKQIKNTKKNYSKAQLFYDVLVLNKLNKIRLEQKENLKFQEIKIFMV